MFHKELESTTIKVQWRDVLNIQHLKPQDDEHEATGSFYKNKHICRH